MNEKFDSEVAFSIIVSSILFIILAFFFIAFIITYRKKKRQHKAEKKKLASDFAETLLQTQLEIKEQTLQNISRELHDNFGQLASLINIHLNVIPHTNPKQASESIKEAKELTKELITGIKKLSLGLNGDRLREIGLITALQEEVVRLRKLALFTIDIQIKGDEFSLSENKTIILFRMSQEILNNIIKHSNAKEVLIKITFLENLLTLVFHDNGLGFTIGEKTANKGNGLINLQNRAATINADLTVSSSEGNGTSITIRTQR